MKSHIYPAGRRRLKVLVLLALVLLVGTALLAKLYFNALITPVDPSQKGNEVILDIPPNASGEYISQKLYQAGLTRGPEVFKLYARYRGITGKLKPGKYIFNPAQPLEEIATALVAGPPDKIAFTVPEGYDFRQLVDMLSQRGLIQREEFTRLVFQGDFGYSFLEGIPRNSRRLEGYLFPDTYHIGSETTEKEIIEMMLKRFNDELVKINFSEHTALLGLSLHQGVTLASMVEREARVDRERPLIAGVMLNRLHRGMKLQIDATVEYALGGHRDKIYYKDLETDSPYNTYKYYGLPPGPISFPGEASLLAAVHPETTDYLYYVARPDGTHVFSKTLAEHNANKAKYIK
ncbi:hypothetical protein DCCM_3355 [Desulfocucumis palustris]|uniref:Endolytic murein transglycosylase n=1 Tax=Desulfocucumis palustris TaxID=1898651 RepID=A0A2L2XEW3_9FIRM|nr:endolytic transglycosylase MltG [Desulfocucumis palustris]GBF34243.1 hypothetical protein DCCM_3355 [Desulfocucumis palustris]